MVTVTIRQAAERRDIKTAYQLQKIAAIPPSMAARLWSGELKMIGIDTIDKLCGALECEPNDLFRYEMKRRRAKK